ncbi:hypothetical protein [Fluviicola sp.]|uniref:hypothetical protein n=1 Tax=Fluviicola sp. TaxID=1917219 RepID=UPI0026255339|nr:hypothetical protein [Fluviicola sp.]
MEKSFEKVNADLEKIDLSAYEEGGAYAFTAADINNAPGDVLQKVCKIYRVVRPAFSVIVSLPFIPEKIKSAIRTFMGALDMLCPE